VSDKQPDSFVITMLGLFALMLCLSVGTCWHASAEAEKHRRHDEWHAKHCARWARTAYCQPPCSRHRCAAPSYAKNVYVKGHGYECLCVAGEPM